MRRLATYITLLLALLSCSNHPGQVRLKGSFAHLEQGEFFLYSTDRVLDHIDTLRIQDGRFSYTLPLEGEATLEMLYPNFSHLTLFAAPGKDLRIEGDARNLSEVSVEGTPDNELYTQFRRQTKGKPAAETLAAARQFITEHAGLALSKYLFREYFLRNDSLPREELRLLYDTLLHARPADYDLMRLSTEVRSHGLLTAGQPLPPFEWQMRLTTKDDEAVDTLVRSQDFRGKYLLIIFWAGWKTGSQQAHYRARRLRREMRDTLHVLSYSLDYSEKHLKFSHERDSINYPNYCDWLCWGSPQVQQWGIRMLPFYILVGPDQRIIASGTDWTTDIAPKTSDLCS